MRPYALLYLYRRRLRAHAIQELLAGLGIAAAVALAFAALVANGSIAKSASEVVHTVTGPASLQLRTRGPEGFDEALLAKVEHLSGVKQAAPMLEATGTVIGPGGRHVTLAIAGAQVSLAILDGLAHTLPGAVLAQRGLGVSARSANALGITAGAVRVGQAPAVSLQLRGSAYPLNVTAVLGPEAVGALAHADVAVMPLSVLQQLAGQPHRISRILVQAEPGRAAAVSDELRALAGGGLTVAPADRDVALLRQALRPGDLATNLFAVIAGLLGFLFAFNAMLLTVPERRRAIADLRLSGTRRPAIVQMVIFQALCLGVAASLLGVLAGYGLSLGVFHQSAGYLSQVFVLGGGTVVGVGPILLALIGGTLATCLAASVLLFDLRPGRALDAVYFEEGVPGNALDAHVQRRLFLAAIGLLVAATVLFLAVPSAAIAACVLLALATVLAVPLVLSAVLLLAGALARRNQRLTILPVALAGLRATTVRSLALAATGAVALFGAVALSGSRADLLRGIAGSADGFASDASVWVISPHDNQATVSFLEDGLATRIGKLRGVARVRAFLGGFDEFGGRRVWVIARPAGTGAAQLRGQMIHGSAAVAVSDLRGHGWVVIPEQIAAEHHVSVGGRLVLPTPSGDEPFKVAATTTNLGWPTGVIVINSTDYERAWQTSSPTALGVTLRPGVGVAAGIAAVRGARGAQTGLEVIPASTRAARIEASSSEGTHQLGEISTLLLIAAILALCAALGSAIWERRRSLAGLRLAGARSGRLRRILLVEASLTLGAGCVTGVVAGVYGQLVLDGYLKQVTGFPVASVATGWRPLEILAIVIAVVLVVVSVPGWFAARAPMELALEDE